MVKRRPLTPGMPKTTPIAPGIVQHFDGRDLFIIVNGVKVAKRGRPNTPQARTWIALDPRFEAHGEYEWSYSSDRKETKDDTAA